MFRLIKLALYAFVGYSIYQLYLGMRQQQQQGGGRRRSSGAFGREYDAGLSDQTRTGQNLTGAGRGRAEVTLDNDGGSVRHNVGRGVVST